MDSDKGNEFLINKKYDNDNSGLDFPVFKKLISNEN